MNLFLHGIDGSDVQLGDTLAEDGRALTGADLILTNPPFGPAGGRPSRTDLSITGTVSSFALPFVEHCARTLNQSGRAAIVVPDSVLYEEGRGKALRTYLLDKFDVHTVLRLPSGIFYAQSVKTNVMFLNRRQDGQGTKRIWFYDLRTDMPAFSKSVPLSASHFDEFALFFGAEADGSDRPESKTPPDRRARRYDRSEIAALDDSLDVSWLREDEADEGASEPEELIATVQGYLSQALDEVRALAEELDRACASSQSVDRA
jgi:type I restriction enzyme M protein